MSIKIIKLEHKISNIDPLLIDQHKTVVLEAEDLYPGIDIWYNKKVKPGLEEGERIGYLIQKNGSPVGEITLTDFVQVPRSHRRCNQAPSSPKRHS